MTKICGCPSLTPSTGSGGKHVLLIDAGFFECFSSSHGLCMSLSGAPGPFRVEPGTCGANLKSWDSLLDWSELFFFFF